MELECHELLSKFAFDLNLRRCIKAATEREGQHNALEKKVSEVPIAHNETLTLLNDVVERASALVQRQCTRNYLSQLINQAAVTKEFEAGAYNRQLASSTLPILPTSVPNFVRKLSPYLFPSVILMVV